MRGLMSTPPGQKRNKARDAYNAERDWQRNLAFVSGSTPWFHQTIPC
jgi:hypothetical protein